MSATLTRMAAASLRATSRCRIHAVPAHTNTARVTVRHMSECRNPPPKKGQQQRQTPQHGQPEMVPKTHFRAMFEGAHPLVKGVVYTMVIVMGTVETYTYGLWAWHYFYPREGLDGQGDEGEGAVGR
ncbi:uncharacterized protein LTR77_009274 [Saxophila tyrrhenica]|uniref:Uncharacterized protein n=1 Tax=Saxophila tyrrhenica TaxID=1690608 RepID=A0AAV9NYZ4_9PEZI|nr:hypothetical protein LTR77_009274 [Saxophila tyrrhenica]